MRSAFAVVGLVVGLVVAIVFQPAAVDASGGKALLVVGGLGSTVQSTKGLFAVLVSALPDYVRVTFSYASKYEGQEYGPEETCQPLSTSEDRLLETLLVLNASGATRIVIVGHSIGGVIAFDTIRSHPELAKFVQAVVTVDAPLGGLGTWENAAGDALFSPVSPCTAIDELWYRRKKADWNDDVAAGARLIADAVPLLVVSNTADRAVAIDEQTVWPDVPVNLTLEVRDRGANHSAVLKNAYSATQIAVWVTRTALGAASERQLAVPAQPIVERLGVVVGTDQDPAP